ncbi:MAG: hypothetical protein NTY64_24550 [Deltaproteobacteria bacterium]|nr:hypothetical protein [Deltaproteobacteria bacterium]
MEKEKNREKAAGPFPAHVGPPQETEAGVENAGNQDYFLMPDRRRYGDLWPGEHNSRRLPFADKKEEVTQWENSRYIFNQAVIYFQSRNGP